MNRTAIAFLTKDRVELTKRTVVPLLQLDKFDLHWCDGSSEVEGRLLFRAYPSRAATHPHVRGGADAAIVFALTEMLADKEYTHVGLCENDVLLSFDWFERTMDLFNRGTNDGLNVGAVSPRCYEDRVLIQRDSYAVMHNLGAGIVIFTREAARLVLDSYRSAWSTDNRNIFCQLSGIDIGTYWAFRAQPHWLTADWGFDAVLVRSGLASLALTPSPVEMIGQNPPLVEQGLTLATGPVERLRNDQAFETYCERSKQLWEGLASLTAGEPVHRDVLGNYTVFPHQVHKLNGVYAGDWRLKWCQGFGPFAWRATAPGDSLCVTVTGHCEFLVSGGSAGAQVELTDDCSGFTCAPVLVAEGADTQVMSVPAPAGVSCREVRLTALTAGAVFYGIRSREPQLLHHDRRFGHSMLPPV